MKNNIDRRAFLKSSAVTAGGLAFGTGMMPDVANEKPREDKPIRLGFIGVGDRGSYHLDSALGIEGVEVPAVCDINNAVLYRAKQWIEESGQPTPALYGKTNTDFIRMCETEELDAIICSTSWKWHGQICLAAQNNDKHAVCEVPIVLTVDEGWQLVEAYESTGKWATLGRITPMPPKKCNKEIITPV